MSEILPESSYQRVKLLKWITANRIVSQATLQYLSPMEGKSDAEKEEIARDVLEQLQKLTADELAKIQHPPLTPEEERQYAEYKAWLKEMRNRPELAPDDPAAILLEDLSGMICEQLMRPRHDRLDALLLFNLNTAEKVRRFSRWLATQMHGETLLATEDEIIEVSYLIDQGKDPEN